jgi:hypothetical protein
LDVSELVFELAAFLGAGFPQCTFVEYDEAAIGVDTGPVAIALKPKSTFGRPGDRQMTMGTRSTSLARHAETDAHARFSLPSAKSDGDRLIDDCGGKWC